MKHQHGHQHGHVTVANIKIVAVSFFLAYISVICECIDKRDLTIVLFLALWKCSSIIIAFIAFYQDIWYDEAISIFRYQFATTGEKLLESIYGHTKLTVLNDARSEITYTQDLDHGNCTILLHSDWVKQFPSDSTSYHGSLDVMKDPVNFFMIPKDAMRYGKLFPHKMRDFESNAWITKRNDYPTDNPTEMTFEWHFTSTKWVVYEGKSLKSYGNNPYVQMG